MVTLLFLLVTIPMTTNTDQQHLHCFQLKTQWCEKCLISMKKLSKSSSPTKIEELN